MKKKLVAGILMAALAVSCLTGCEGLNEKSNPPAMLGRIE